MATGSISISLLRIIARHRPELWELIHPHVPLIATTARFAVADGLNAVALNPQPLPPGEELVAITRSTARAIADVAIAASTTGQDARQLLTEIVDDWCPTPPTPKI